MRKCLSAFDSGTYRYSKNQKYWPAAYCVFGRFNDVYPTTIQWTADCTQVAVILIAFDQAFDLGRLDCTLIRKLFVPNMQ